jgi:aspartate kinase
LDAPKTLKLTKKAAKKIGTGDVLEDDNIARVSIVGVGMKSHPGVAAKCFEVLAKNKINIGMISTADISISCIIHKKFAEASVRALHEKFGLGK